MSLESEGTRPPRGERRIPAGFRQSYRSTIGHTGSSAISIIATSVYALWTSFPRYMVLLYGTPVHESEIHLCRLSQVSLTVALKLHRLCLASFSIRTNHYDEFEAQIARRSLAPCILVHALLEAAFPLRKQGAKIKCCIRLTRI